MTALAADRNTVWSQGEEQAYPVATGVTIYAGSLVCLNASGYAAPAADTASFIFIGVSTENVVNAGANGAATVTVKRSGIHRFACTGMAITDIGKQLYVLDDQTVGLAAAATNDVFVGILAEFTSATNVGVDILPGLTQPDVSAHIADGTDAHDASAISILDSGSFTTTANVETALAEIYPRIPALIADPGDAGAIAVTRSGNCALTTAAAETRTLAIPAFIGQRIDITLDVDGGNAVVTAAAAINQAGNNTITMGDAGDTISLVGVQVGGARVWRVLVNDGNALSTV